MTMEIERPAVREWSWEQPAEDSRPNFGKLEPIDISPPYTRQRLGELGLSGLQFAEWKSLHPGCLDTDIVGLVDGNGVSTEPGRIYRLDGESYFVQLDARDALYERGARPRMPDRPAFMMNLVFSFWGHRWVYEFEELRFAFEQAGYPVDEVRRCSFGAGANGDVASMDRPHRRHETMYMEASAPAAAR